MYLKNNLNQCAKFILPIISKIGKAKNIQKTK